jgi:outer membrane protein assembly factor BamB
MKTAARRASLALILLLPPLTAAWAHRSEMTFLWWIVPGSVFLALLMLGPWYLLFGSAPVRRRWLRVSSTAVGIVSVGYILSLLVRYEGSGSGSSYPVFAWTWEERRNPPPAPSASASLAAPTPTLIPSDAVADVVDFLGPDRDGMWEHPLFATDWNEAPPRLLWKRPIGKGWSSFTVARGHALTQQQIGDDEHITSLDLATGQDRWSHADPQTRLLLERTENGGAAMGGDGPRATPVVHGNRVYTMGSTGVVNCLELETGRLVWSRHLLRDLGSIAHRWGMANSPLILTNPPLVVFAGPEKPGPTLVACDLDTGETRWVSKGGGASYSSPRLVTLGGVEQIVSVNYTDLSGLDPETGRVLWSHPWPLEFPKVGQPLLLSGDRLLVTASYGAGSLLLAVKRAPSGVFSVERIWKTTSLKTKFSTAAIIGNHAYGLDEGRLACIGLADGKRVWKKDKFGFGQHLLFGEWLLVQTEPGEVVIGKLGPEGFAESGRIPALSSMTWNIPTVAGRLLLVRNDREASAWLLPDLPEAAPGR